MQIFKYKKLYTAITKGITNISKTEVEIYRRLFLKDFKDFELLAVEVKLFQALRLCMKRIFYQNLFLALEA